ncbi:MAG TPA: hypothetical protein PKZ53_20355, partial [Acidobacteriota bacterium]|nr:hypothetical protein [Acidobacteriota bacterium]
MPILLFIFALSSPVWAQSGGRSKQNPPFDPQTKPQAKPGGTNLVPQQSRTFFVVTSPHDDSKPYPLEDTVRNACQDELRSISGVKIIENENVLRWEAKDLAFSADNQTWVIWIELKFNDLDLRHPDFLKVQYLLFESGSGRVLSGGFASTSAKNWQSQNPWPWPASYVDLRVPANYAGRDV